MKKNFDCRLLYSDTDSLLYEVKGKDFYRTLAENNNLRNHFDLSNYQQTHELYNTDQKMVTLKFKDEFAGQPLEEFIGLKPKMYSILYGGKQKLSAKGVTRFAQNNLKHELYRHVLNTRESFTTINTRIGSKNHQLQTIRTQKKSLSCFDDKRYIMDDGITCLPLGHYSIRDIGVFREILEDDAWGEELTQPSPTWSEFQDQGWVPENHQRRSPSDLLRHSRTPDFDTTLDLLLNCSPPDPGFHQRQYTEEELNQDLVDFDDTTEEPSQPRNPFIDDEAEDEVQEEMEEETIESGCSSDIQVIAEYTEDERNLMSDIENFFEFNSQREAVGIRPLKRARLTLDSDSD